MKQVSAADLDELSRKATTEIRQRAHLNVHPTLDDPVQRLFMALEPATYVRPHRHSDPARWELFVLIAGSVDALTLDDEGKLIERVRLAPTETRAVEIPAPTWHSYVCLEPGTVVLEVKQGPYIPATESDFAPWAPRDDPAAVAAYLRWMRTATAG